MQERRLGSYELMHQLGEGGMAQVYLARDTRLGREVAVKVLDSRLAERPGFRERFLREARVAAALDHPNIIPLYDYGETGALYLVMPYLSGGSLQEMLKRGPLPASTVATYGAQIADALDYAHRRNVVHRDVKPANMLLHADGRVMLSDFGLAKILDNSSQPIARRGRPDAGTPEYMAPEQIEGRTEARSDIYGLGVVLYLLLTGHLPFTGPTSAAVMEGHLYRLPEPLRQRHGNVSPAMEAVVLRALAKHPEDRYQTAGELGAALLAALVAGNAEPLPFISGPSIPPMSPITGISQVPGQMGSGIPPSLGPSQATGVPAGGRATARVLPRLDSAAASQRSPYASASSSSGRGSYSSSVHGHSGMLPSYPPALQPAHRTPPVLVTSTSLAPEPPYASPLPSPLRPVAVIAPASEPLVTSTSWRLRITLAVLFVLLLVLIGAILSWAGVLPTPGL
jgi:eukaryotic-like serine/threonine-protein kinase